MSYIIRRALYTLILMVAISMVAFAVIQLPPGDYVTAYIAELQQSSRGGTVNSEMADALRKSLGVDRPIHIQYLRWMSGMLQGDIGRSLAWRKPVSELIAERLPLTIAISILSLLFVYLTAIPIGIYSATHQYSITDHGFTFIGFIGLATPNFILALIPMVVFFQYFGLAIGGLFSTEHIDAPWGWVKFFDLLKHLPVPIIVIGTAGTASLIRVMRACLLDELRKQYVVTARAKGLPEGTLLFRYPARIALNPVVSTIGWTLPFIVSGETITAVVLSLPTMGPLLLKALLDQDMHLAGSAVMFLTFLTIVGTFISDVLLVSLDPRIRFETVAV